MRPLAVTRPFGRNTFIPAGCLHYPVGEIDLLRRWVRAVATAENGFTILMGDMLDSARTHYRNHIRGYRQDENSQLALDEFIKRDVEKLARELEPIKGRIVGAIQGNHFWEFADGTTSDQYLCRLLSVPYLGPLGIVRLDFRDPRAKDNRVRFAMTVWAHHNGGSNGGRTTGGDVNALERAENSFDADIYVLSHTHRRHAHKLPILRMTTKGVPRLVERTKVFVRSGAFLKGFKEDKPSTEVPYFPQYAEKAAYRPTDLGWVTVTIDMSNHHGQPQAGLPQPNEIKQEVTLSY